MISPFTVAPLHVSPRIHFQLFYASQTPERAFKTDDGLEMVYPNILNIGCADDPVGLGNRAVHYDMDRNNFV